MVRLYSFIFAFLFFGQFVSADLVKNLSFYANSPSYAKRVGLEVELSGLGMNQIVNILRLNHGGLLVPREKIYNFVDPTTGLAHEFKTNYSEIIQTRLDTIVVKPEDNQPTLHGMATVEDPTRIYEIVSSPMQSSHVWHFQKSLDLLKNAGGLGTSEDLAVALQVNVEMGKGVIEEIKPKNIINILRNFLSEPNRSIIAQHLNLPDVRKKYVGMPAPGFMKRIMRDDYAPTWDEFYMDAMYRSNLENLGVAGAWTMPDNKARLELKKHLDRLGFEAVLPMMKWQFVRYSSLMMHMRPNEWLSKYLTETDWFHSHPILEFREPSNHFDAENNVKWILSLIAASEDHGVIDLRSLGCGSFLNASGI